jgi:L-alanine-DL-glutamate epimerase-like enolase superfamily enzyme
MQISNVHIVHIHKTYVSEARNTRHDWKGKNYLLLLIETDSGEFGVGELYCDGHTSPLAQRAMIQHEIVPLLLGRDPGLIKNIRAELTAMTVLSGRRGGFGPVCAAVDIALWDLLGKLSGQPVCRLLGQHTDQVAVYGSGGMYGPEITPDSLAAAMKDAVDGGVCGVKIKAGGASLEEDLARVKAVRQAIGDDAHLMIDAMFTPTLPEAIAMARAMRPYNLHFIEAPTEATDLDGWRQVLAAGGTPLAGPELESDTYLMRDFVTQGIVHYLQYDVVLAGGLTSGAELGAFAAMYRRPVTLHCAASAVGLAASAHLAAALPNCASVEFHLVHQGLFEHLWASGWRLENGSLVVSDKPGLGLDLTLDELLAMEVAT